MADLDPQLVDAVKGFEGYTPTAKPDFKQLSNGYGTKAMYPGETIDRQEANSRLQDELYKAKTAVEGMGVDMTPGQKNALTSLTYNVGPGWMQHGLGQAVRAGDWDTAAQKMQEYSHAGGEYDPGLAKRRATEASWFGGAPILTAINKASRAMGLNFGGGQDQSQQAPQQPQGGPNAWDKIGDTMQRMAAWGMSINHPEALNALGTLDKNKQLNRPVWGVIGERVDPMTGQSTKQYGWINANNQTINGQPAQGGSGSIGGGASSMDELAARLHAARNTGAAPEDMISLLPEGIQDLVKGAGEYRIDPSKFSMRSPERTAIQTYTPIIYPGYDINQAKERSDLVANLEKGAPSSVGGALNAGRHALEILGNNMEAAADLGNNQKIAGYGGYGSGLAAEKANAVKNSTSDMRDKIAAVQDSGQSLGGEAAKVYYGNNGGGERERELIAGRHANSNLTPGGFRGAAQTTERGLIQKMKEYNAQIEAAFGKNSTQYQRYAFGNRPGDQEAIARLHAAYDRLKQQEGGGAAPTLGSKPALPKGVNSITVIP